MDHTPLYNKTEQYVTKLFHANTSENLVFHNIDHTKYVVEKTKEIAAHYKLNDEELLILFIAAWFHDTGYLFVKPSLAVVCLLNSSQISINYKLEFPGIVLCWFITSSGVFPFKELCGLKQLYSILHASIFSRASSIDMNQLVFKHSSLKLPLNDSMNGLSVGFPGLE